ncbi:MAG: hypothetical protein IT290_12630 [Deltaproteobacteria bacterium]|nr:hypothetical protein [Deltaproteobacteria bacterium]
MEDISTIIEKVTERYSSPIRVGSRCEANVFYRVEYLSPEDIDTLTDHIAERIQKVCSPLDPELIISLPNYTELAKTLARRLSTSGEPLEVVNAEQLNPGNGKTSWLRGMNVILVNDVITTARSCLEVHTKATVLGATVLCWAAIIDRTFGPGPVPVAASFTGEPVRLLDMA